MNIPIKSALGLCFAALSMNHALAADDSEIDMTCDSEKPVIMLVACLLYTSPSPRDRG